MGWLSDALRFEGSHVKDLWDGIRKDPKRLVLGVDPLSTGAWNAVLGREDEPLVNQFGGILPKNVDNAQARGINTGAGETLHGIANTVASFYGGQAAGAGLGEAAGAMGVGGGAGGSGTNWAQYAQLAAKGLNAGGGQPVPQAVAPPSSGLPQKPNAPSASPVISESGAMGGAGGRDPNTPGPVIQPPGAQTNKRKIDPRMLAAILRGQGKGGGMF